VIKDYYGNSRFFGVYRGVVVDNQDPLNRGRLRLQVPQILQAEITGWAWASLRPGIANVTVPIGTPVWVMFEGGDPSFPIWVGMTADQVTGVPVPVTGDLIPDIDDAYRLGTAEKRWKSLQLGPGTLYIEDTVTHEQAAIGVTDGSLTIDGAARIQIGNMKMTTTGLTFPDGSTQTQAAPQYYGSFYNTTTVSLTSATTAYPLPLDTTAEADGVSIVSSSRITVAHAGVYNIQFSAQLDKTDSQDDLVNIWFAKNGTNIAHSNTQVTVLGNNGKYLASWNYVLTLAANDYVQIMAQSPDTNMRIVAAGTQTSPDRPAVPSVIVTVTEVR